MAPGNTKNWIMNNQTLYMHSTLTMLSGSNSTVYSKRDLKRTMQHTLSALEGVTY